MWQTSKHSTLHLDFLSPSIEDHRDWKIMLQHFFSSSRELRNKAEKLRRDRLSTLMNEMKSLVPIICDKYETKVIKLFNRIVDNKSFCFHFRWILTRLFFLEVDKSYLKLIQVKNKSNFFVDGLTEPIHRQYVHGNSVRKWFLAVLFKVDKAATWRRKAYF